MALWRKKGRRRKAPQVEAAAGKAQTHRTRKSFPPEVKLLAVRACEVGLTSGEVAEIVGAGSSSVSAWVRTYSQGGVEALVRKSTNAGTRRICEKLERLIEQRRREHPEEGVRRVRDELKRQEGVAVSAETVRRVVNEAGLGQPGPSPRRQPPGGRRFERQLPNALWQIDIFTF